MHRPPRKKTIDDLAAIMAALRTPGTGCPWDLEQSFETIAPYTIEEAYEVADAVQRGDRDDLKDELGDLLLQVVYHARMAEEEGAFDFHDVVEAISAKMVRRHPHVFGDADIASSTELSGLWERIKAEEKAAKPDGGGDGRRGALNGVPVGLPALTRAVKLQKKAARVGFDWDDAALVIAKIREEISELETELERSDSDRTAIESELGDLLFALANLARHLKIDPEAALRSGNAKFVRRFERIEALLAERGREAGDCSLEELEALWRRAKAEER